MRRSVIWKSLLLVVVLAALALPPALSAAEHMCDGEAVPCGHPSAPCTPWPKCAVTQIIERICMWFPEICYTAPPDDPCVWLALCDMPCPGGPPCPPPPETT